MLDSELFLKSSIDVSCDFCGEIGDDHEIPCLQFPDGSFHNCCDECFKKKSCNKTNTGNES